MCIVGIWVLEVFAFHLFVVVVVVVSFEEAVLGGELGVKPAFWVVRADKCFCYTTICLIFSVTSGDLVENSRQG